MKKILVLVLLLISGIIANAQKEGWKEMHSFHDVMSATFHPSEENDLQPLRNNAATLLEKAKAWKNSEVPAGYNSEMTQSILKKLVAECEAINGAVKKNKPDAELKSIIAKAHDTFHEIMEKCKI